MIEMKLIEIRDNATCIPALALRITRNKEMDPESHWLLGRSGYGEEPCVLLIKLAEPNCEFDPYDWKGGSRTMPAAHIRIQEMWDFIKDGDVIDAGVVVGEREEPLNSDRCYSDES